jgi:hypothetical protein
MKNMFKKIALCAMLVLFLAPASVMAAGPQGQEQGIGNAAGNCLNVQHQIAGDTTVQEKFQNGQSQGSGIAMQKGDANMLQTRSCDQDCDQDLAMVRNMTRDQIRLDSESGLAGKNQGAGQNGDGQRLQEPGGCAEWKIHGCRCAHCMDSPADKIGAAYTSTCSE